MEIHENIKKIMDEEGITVYKLAKLSGLSQTGIKYFINGEKSPTVETLEKICDALKINLKSLFNGNGELDIDEKRIISLYNTANNQAKETAFFALEKGQVKKSKQKNTMEISESIFPYNVQKGYLIVPVVGRSAAGMPIEMIQEYDASMEISDPKIQPGDFAVIADGDSMIKAGIHHGDRVIIRPQPTVENGEIALVAVEDGSTIKRFYMNENGFKLLPENDAHEVQYYPKAAPVRVIGKFIKVADSYRERHFN
jgi:repressor LexA